MQQLKSHKINCTEFLSTIAIVTVVEMSLSQEAAIWYQDPNYVTASVKIVQKNLKNYTAKFTDTGFSVYADGQFVYVRTLP